MADEVVLGLVDRLSLAESIEVLAEQVVVERVRMVPVQFAAFIERQLGEIPVVGVHVDEHH